MKRRNLLAGMYLTVLALTCTVALGAASQDLQRAIDLYKAADYVHARDLLQHLDPSALTDQQRATRADYLSRAQHAVQKQAILAPSQPLPRPDQVFRIQDDVTRTPQETYIRYPGNWAQIVRRQERYGASQRMEDKPTRQTRRQFAALVPQISFEPPVPFADAIDRIRRDSGLNIVVNWPALQQFGITPQQEVTLPRLTNLPWQKVTELLLQQVSASIANLTQLDWAIEGSILTISTREDLSTNLTLRVYDIGDLLVPRQTVPQSTGSSLTGTPTGTGPGRTGP